MEKFFKICWILVLILYIGTVSTVGIEIISEYFIRMIKMDDISSQIGSTLYFFFIESLNIIWYGRLKYGFHKSVYQLTNTTLITVKLIVWFHVLLGILGTILFPLSMYIYNIYLYIYDRL